MVEKEMCIKQGRKKKLLNWNAAIGLNKVDHIILKLFTMQ